MIQLLFVGRLSMRDYLEQMDGRELGGQGKGKIECLKLCLLACFVFMRPNIQIVQGSEEDKQKK